MRKILNQDEIFDKLNKNSHDLFLWSDGGVVAMARIANKGNKYARINTVVTNREHRGKGYAKMLVGDICKQLLEQGLIPMLYADARNPSSNSTYQKIGFREVGKISEYTMG
jgi:predicted GNAT family acetyltransferase